MQSLESIDINIERSESAVMTASYALSAWIFTRALGAIYLIAFLSLTVQARALWGSQGILPVSGYLKAVHEQLPTAARYVNLPSIFWLNSSDGFIMAATWIGAAAAVALMLGFAQGWMLAICFVLYLSFVSSGQDFMSFQWDALLCEVGFLMLFAVPWSLTWQPWLAQEPHWLVRFMFYGVLFKLMFLSGVVKLMSGDPSWRDLSAMSYHYWTQPLPNPLSPFMHFLPKWYHQFESAITFVIELACPFLIFWPRARPWAAIGFIFLSITILATGNFTFFNWLTIAICFWLIPDSWWRSLLEYVPLPIVSIPASGGQNLFTVGAMGCLLLMSIFWCTRWLMPDNWQRTLLPMLKFAQVFHISNSYGLFANMTKTRPEIVLEGSNDGKEWREYEFLYKPGSLTRRPPQVAPYHPRLDWQMWFAALGRFENSPWLQMLMLRIFEHQPDVLARFAVNPFPDQAPKYLRAQLYQYEFTSTAEILREGKWWSRTFTAPFSPVFTKP